MRAEVVQLYQQLASTQSTGFSVLHVLNTSLFTLFTSSATPL